MLYGTPQRAAHRAPADGVHVLHRPKPRRRASPEPERAAQFLARGLATLIVLGITVLTGMVIVADERHGRGGAASAAVRPVTMLDTRAVDAAPLTLEEVFPDRGEVRPATAPAPYRIAMTHIDSECRTASSGILRPMLQDRRCSQVVRAVLTAPYDGYEVTAGLFNLADAAGAADLDGRLRALVETGEGGFTGLAGEPTGAQVGWRASGHYLLYCVISRPGGEPVRGDDPYAQRINHELVDAYLGETVLGRRLSGT